MPKKRSYPILRHQVFKYGNYSIVPIRYEDRFQIMAWRNEQIYHLRQDRPLTPDIQEDYFNHVVKKLFEVLKPNQLLFSFLKNDLCIGYGGLVHINWIDKNAEISFIMNTSLEKTQFKHNWIVFLRLLEKVAFNELEFHKIYTYAFDIRPKLYPVLESFGFAEEARLKEHCFFEGKYKDVVMHAKYQSKVKIRVVNENDIWTIYEWSNDPVTRSNSFYTKPLNREDHKKWFTNKFDNKESILLIGELEDKAFGLVRYEIEDNRSVVGINISKDYRGRGLAAKILKLSLQVYHTICDKPIDAYIKIENLASKKTFEKVGYQYIGNEEINNFKSLVYRYDR